MITALAGLLLVPVLGWAAGDLWEGTINGRSVRCVSTYGPVFGRPSSVTGETLWCRGAARRSLRFHVDADPAGSTLDTQGRLCRRGPRPPRWRPRHQRRCCALVGTVVEGNFTRSAMPYPGAPVTTSGTARALRAGLSCRRRQWPLGAVDLRKLRADGFDSGTR